MSTSKGVPFSVRPGASKNVAVVECTVGPKWEQWFLLQSDVHWDNPDCDLRLYEKHLKQAKERGAGVLQFGDTFCVMQGKYDKRSDKSKLREEHRCGDYLDSVVRTAADFHQPYADNMVLVGYGNHETSIRDRHETDLIQRFVGTLRDRNAGCTTLAGGYAGYVRFAFTYGTSRFSKKLWYIHGYGGGGAVTKDMIQANRQQVYVGDADIMVSGHTHHQWEDFNVRTVLNNSDVVEQQEFVYLKLGSYKDEYKSGAGGWHVETGKGPRPRGGFWLKFFAECIDGTKRIRFTTERAC